VPVSERVDADRTRAEAFLNDLWLTPSGELLGVGSEKIVRFR
jgi:hypothetical protein